MLHDKLVASPFFSGFAMKRKSRALQIMPQNVPYLGSYIVDETMLPDGDLNTGDIRFINTLRIGFSVVVFNNDPVACEAKLDEAYWTICNTLWTDQYLMNRLDTRAYPGGVGNPDNTRIEGVGRGTRRFNYGTTLNNEQPIGEVQYEASLVYRNNFAPVIVDDLLEIAVRTGVKAGETQEEMDQRQQVGAQYLFTTEP